MQTLLLGISVVLVLVILFMIFKLTTLIGVAKGSKTDVDAGSNKVNASLMLIFLIVSGIITLWFSYSWFGDYHLPVASDHGVITDKLFWITMGITGVAFVLTQILLFYFAFRYSYKKNSTATYYPDNHKLELVWTLVPAVVLTVLILYGLKVWNNITSPAPQEAEVIEVMGAQFAWRVRYPGEDNKLGRYDYRKIDASNAFGMDLSDKNSLDDFVPRELHLPKGKPVLLKIRARDVLHSVFLPHFRLKMDAVPGMPTQFWFVPSKSTEDMRKETGNPDFNYELACTEICGKGHFSMRMLVVVDEPADYEAWKKEQKTWLSLNPEYMSQVPEELKEVAMISSGIETSESKDSSL
ncbi:MAG: cytochrome c oxidase subunit II [Cyclobacteriaceae bacterium]|nr:cytochrome c oxidase subunit II [Cyclobacteriaceae bacterium]